MLLANKMGHAYFVKSVYESYRRMGCNPYDTVYGQAKRLGAYIITLSPRTDDLGFSYPDLRFEFSDGTKGVLTLEGFEITKSN